MEEASWEKERLLLVFPFSIGSESSIASSYKCFVLEPSEEDQERGVSHLLVKSVGNSGQL